MAPNGTPNILIIVGDDHAGGTLGIDGDPRLATPRLDRFAREGVRFARAYANAPVCTPSRQSFLTGRLPHASGVTLLTTPLDEAQVTLADWLGDRGFSTVSIGKMHFISNLSHGFRERIDTPQWRTWLNVNHPEAVSALKPFRPFVDPPSVWLNSVNRPIALTTNQMEATFFADQAKAYFQRPRDRPFFMVIGFNQPHSPFAFPKDGVAKYKAEDFTVPPMSDYDKREQPEVFSTMTADEFRGSQAAYYNSISFLDASVGRVLDGLQASGQAENTIVVYLGDNGYSRGYHGRFEKHCLYEQAVRVPLLIRWPKHLPADRKIDAMVELVDLFPTLTELAKEGNPSGIQGMSLAPLAQGDANAKGREFVFSEHFETEEAMIRSDRYKLIVGTGARERTDGYETGRPLTGPSIRLYDAQEDPGEMTNLSDRPDQAETIAKLQKALFERLTTTRDGLKPIPAGLDELASIHWCLVPLDKQPPRKKKPPIKNAPSEH